MKIVKTEKKWYAVYTNPRAEKKVAQRISDEGLDCYCPTKTSVRQWSDRKKTVEEPLFTSYVFVRVRNIQMEKVRQVSGVVNFVYYLGKPAVIRDKEIEDIKNFLDCASHSEIKFEKDEHVTINEGVLKNVKGEVESITKNTIKIRIEQLGMTLYAEVRKDFVEKLPKQK